MRLKEELKGGTTKSKILNGMIKIEDKNIPIFLQEGRYDLFENNPKPKKLEPIENKSEEKTVNEIEGESKPVEKKKQGRPKKED